MWVLKLKCEGTKVSSRYEKGNDMLKYLISSAKSALPNMYNEVWKPRTFPKEWSESTNIREKTPLVTSRYHLPAVMAIVIEQFGF
jgi:hypothetical protein